MPTEATAVAVEVPPPPPVIKLRRRRREVPKVNVYSRHTKDCKWSGKDKKIGCPCPKQLVYYRDGKLYRIAADTCDGEVAEAKAREMMNGFAAAAKGEPTTASAAKESYLIDDLVAAFVAKKSADDGSPVGIRANQLRDVSPWPGPGEHRRRAGRRRSGLARRSRRMSGLISVANFTASKPSQASPTTFISCSDSSRRRSPSRKMG
ncbi:MAG: hypothetical protein ABSF85_19630 [Terriglobales bacterium]